MSGMNTGPNNDSVFTDSEHMMRAAGLTRETLERIENWLNKKSEEQDD
jgi:hypothetical protein